MKELIVEAALENLSAVTAFIDEQLEALACPMKAQLQIDVAIDELFGNIAQYAYPDRTDDCPGSVTVRFDFDETTRMASVTFEDGGVPFDPLQKTDPDVTLSAEERGIGGLGIFVVKKTMDQMAYRHERGCNILTLYKRI